MYDKDILTKRTGRNSRRAPATSCASRTSSTRRPGIRFRHGLVFRFRYCFDPQGPKPVLGRACYVNVAVSIGSTAFWFWYSLNRGFANRGFRNRGNVPWARAKTFALSQKQAKPKNENLCAKPKTKSRKPLRQAKTLTLSQKPKTGIATVSFHNFKSQKFKLSVSNPKSKYVAYVSVLSQISNCQGLGRKNKHDILKTDRRWLV